MASTPQTHVSAEPAVALRLVSTVETATGQVRRRVDLLLGAGESVAVEDGVATTFPTERLWPEVRDRLPDLALLRADPHGRPAPAAREPGPDFVETCRAYVVLATVVTDGSALPSTTRPEDAGVIAVRTWLATDADLWSVTPRPDGGNDVRLAAQGALGDLVVWDVTAAFEALVQLAQRGATP